VELRIVARDRELVCVSDKPVDKVIGYAVRFDDGSWANLRSRRYTGSAPGRVFFLRAPASANGAGASRRHDLGRVVELVVSAHGADVLIEPTDAQAALELRGPRGWVDSVKIDQRAGHVRVTWDGNDDGVLRCLVPDRCRLGVEAGGDAHFWIAAPVAAIDAVLDGHSSLVCERAADLELELSGSARAFIARARGRARVRANGSGSAIVAGGHLSALDASVESTGSIVVHATVDDALLSNTGSGALSVPAIGQLSERHAGAGPLLAGLPAPLELEHW
jgi:hypothetical protein